MKPALLCSSPQWSACKLATLLVHVNATRQLLLPALQWCWVQPGAPQACLVWRLLVWQLLHPLLIVPAVGTTC